MFEVFLGGTGKRRTRSISHEAGCPAYEIKGLRPSLLRRKELAVKNYELWLRDPAHPSLHFHRLRGSQDRYAVRVGDHYRALGRMGARAITWVWIGTHEEYNRLVRGE